MRPSYFVIILFVLSPAMVFSQAEWRMWNSAGLNLSFTKKLDLRVNHMRSYSITNQFDNTFNQTSAALGYDFTKRVSVSGGVMNTQIPSSATNTQRYYIRGSFKLPVADILSWSNSIQGEIHSANETRFRNRIIYITRLSNKRRFDFLHLNLSASYWLFYNIGGSPIRYFDKTGAVVTRKSPDGFHRGRLILAANSKLNKHLLLSVYYMRQQEFNFLSSEYRKVNVVNPNTGRIARAFDDYNVAGITLSYNIDLYKLKK